MILLQRTREDGIETGDLRTAAESALDQAAQSRAGAACPDRSSSLAGAHLCSESAHATAWRILHDSGVYAEGGRAGLGSPNVSIGDVEVVTGDGDVEIVFERQCNRFVHRDVEFAIMHELIDAGRIGKVRRSHAPRRVGSCKVRKSATAVSHTPAH